MDPLHEAFAQAEESHELFLVSVDPETFQKLQDSEEVPTTDDNDDQKTSNTSTSTPLPTQPLSSLTPYLTPSLGSSLTTLDISRNQFRTVPSWIFSFSRNLQVLNISRNQIKSLPPEIGQLTQLVTLNALSNHLRPSTLPLEIMATKLTQLQVFDLRYNPKLKNRDFLLSHQHNPTLQHKKNKTKNDNGTKTVTSQEQPDRDSTTFPSTVQVLVTLKQQSSNSHGDKTTSSPPHHQSAGERDATLLRSQLEPLSTPQLRKRLERTFGVVILPNDNNHKKCHASSVDADGEEREQHQQHSQEKLFYDREYLMGRLLDCYERHLAEATTKKTEPAPPTSRSRHTRQESGIPCPPDLLQLIRTELESIQWPTNRERLKIAAQHYMILQRPPMLLSSRNAVDATTASCAATTPGTATSTITESSLPVPVGPKAKREAAKLDRYQAIWKLAIRAMEGVDPDFASRFTALAVTKNFVGSPHIDTLNVGPFYGISLGEFVGGGKIAVECSALEVAEVDTRGRFGKVDGRFPHWVTPYEGTRYSLIYYLTSGDVLPQTTAVFRPKGDANWVPPETFVL